ncbi:hypothetical protein IQB76_17280, partial [Leptospira borgpetersenii serovar Hardjo-bovis]|nr:hypothetical protein [Leptospira borgpetersenii serovar Hardjo-bovis]
MTEIQRLLSETIDDLNIREKRDNRPRFSISFIRKHPGLFIALYAAWFSTLAVMLHSATPLRSSWPSLVFFLPLPRFLFFYFSPPSHFPPIDLLSFTLCYTAYWSHTLFLSHPPFLSIPSPYSLLTS